MLVASLLTDEDNETEADFADDDKVEVAEAVEEATAESGNATLSSPPILDAALLCCICPVSTACSSIATARSSLSTLSSSASDGRSGCDVCDVCDTKCASLCNSLRNADSGVPPCLLPGMRMLLPLARSEAPAPAATAVDERGDSREFADRPKGREDEETMAAAEEEAGTEPELEAVVVESPRTEAGDTARADADAKPPTGTDAGDDEDEENDALTRWSRATAAAAAESSKRIWR